jgi:dTDP-4-dehydrorhamnose reductase
VKVLITGGNGQLGRSLVQALSGDEPIPLSHAELDITDRDHCLATIERERPTAVVHCAALTDTALCERDPGLARRVNGIGSENVAVACRSAGARLVAISSNEVFDGGQSTPYVEDARPHPLNAYAVSKLDGETLAISAHPDTLIVRASWLYGDGYVNFNEKVLNAAREGRALSFVTDEVATPTSTDELARAIGALLDQQAPAGIYHLSNEGEASRFDWANEILKLAGLGDTSVQRTTTPELRANGYSGPVKPQYSVLANTRAAALGITMRPWREALADYFARSPAHADA